MYSIGEVLNKMKSEEFGEVFPNLNGTKIIKSMNLFIL